MARKQKEPDCPPSKAYLVSFGDTMTTLLAFFIVLCSLAEEQTGANLHSGTGSFLRAMDSFGLPGSMTGDYSERAVHLQETSPLYVIPDPEGQAEERSSAGPDAEDNEQRVIDREAEDLQRYLNEIERMFDLDALPDTKGQVAFDFYSKFNSSSPHLSAAYRDALRHILPMLRRPNYQVTIVVWAATPAVSAWSRATDQAMAVGEEVADAARLKTDDRRRLQSYGQPWLYSNIERPVLSVIVRKLESSTK
ncbi:MAG: flagellar motor protein MotB [Pirellulales bacterium]